MKISFEFSDFMFYKLGLFDTSQSTERLPVFILEHGVFGAIILKRCIAGLLENNNVTIDIKLEGCLQTEADLLYETLPPCRMTREHKFLSMTQVLSLATHVQLNESESVKYPFHFDLQAWITRKINIENAMRETATCCNFSHLPLSMRHRSHHPYHPSDVGARSQWANTAQSSATNVIYTLTASLKFNNSILCSTSNHVVLLAAHSPDPSPTYLNSTERGYNLYKQTELNRKTSLKTDTITVSTQEPIQVILKPHRAFTTIRLPLTLELSTITTSKPLKVDITWQLQVTTTTSSGQPPNPSRPSTDLQTTTTTRLQQHTISTNWAHWTSISTDRPRFESKQTLHLLVPQFEILTPTFCSLWVGREYAILVTLDVVGRRHGKIKLVVPVQVGVDGVSVRKYIEHLRGLGIREVSESGSDELYEILPGYQA